MKKEEDKLNAKQAKAKQEEILGKLGSLDATAEEKLAKELSQIKKQIKKLSGASTMHDTRLRSQEHQMLTMKGSVMEAKETFTDLAAQLEGLINTTDFRASMIKIDQHERSIRTLHEEMFRRIAAVEVAMQGAVKQINDQMAIRAGDVNDEPIKHDDMIAKRLSLLEGHMSSLLWGENGKPSLNHKLTELDSRVSVVDIDLGNTMRRLEVVEEKLTPMPDGNVPPMTDDEIVEFFRINKDDVGGNAPYPPPGVSEEDAAREDLHAETQQILDASIEHDKVAALQREVDELKAQLKWSAGENDGLVEKLKDFQKVVVGSKDDVEKVKTDLAEMMNVNAKLAVIIAGKDAEILLLRKAVSKMVADPA